MIKVKPSEECPFCHETRVLMDGHGLCFDCLSKICGNCGMVNKHDVSEEACEQCETFTYQGWTFETLEALEEWAEHEFDDEDEADEWDKGDDD